MTNGDGTAVVVGPSGEIARGTLDNDCIKRICQVSRGALSVDGFAGGARRLQPTASTEE